MIPKIIHYCWFGKDPIPDDTKKYIKSWEKFCPDYKIMRWSESNFDVKTSRFTEQAYQHSQYAFVSDYVRYYALEKVGGIYLDVDMELVKPLDELLSNDFFMGWEGKDENILATCIAASCAKHPYDRLILSAYDNMDFVDDSKGYNNIPNTLYVTEILKRELENTRLNSDELISNVKIYPCEYFHPMNLITGEIVTTPNTYAIHHHSALWVPKSTKIIKFLREKVLIPVMGERLYKKIIQKRYKKSLRIANEYLKDR